MRKLLLNALAFTILISTQVHADSPVIRVNDLTMGSDEFYHRVDQELRFLTRTSAAEPLVMNDTLVALRKRIARDYATQMVSRLLFMSAAHEAGLSVSTGEVDKQLRAISPPDSTMAEIEKLIVRSGGTVDAVRNQIKNELLVNKYVEQMTGKVAITEADARMFYDSHPDDFFKPETVRARHILLSGDTALAEIRKIKTKIARGAGFETIAHEVSECPSSAQGGDLGYFARGIMVDEFEDVAFSLPVGKVSEPVKTMMGYHLIRVEDHPARERFTFDEVKLELMSGLGKTKRSALIRQLSEDLRQNAVIEINL